MRSILITGGAGFIGSCLVRMIVHEKQFRVINLDKLTYAGNRESLDAIKAIKGPGSNGTTLTNISAEPMR